MLDHCSKSCSESLTWSEGKAVRVLTRPYVNSSLLLLTPAPAPLLSSVLAPAALANLLFFEQVRPIVILEGLNMLPSGIHIASFFPPSCLCSEFPFSMKPTVAKIATQPCASYLFTLFLLFFFFPS